MKITKQQVAEVLGLTEDCDPGCLTLSSGVFTYRRGYYWTPKSSPEEFFKKTLEKLFDKFDVNSILYGDNYKSFNGFGGIKKNSHYWMKFKVSQKTMYPDGRNENKTIDVA
ncbi:MAG: hypothetical protein E6Q36_02680 [Chryseobacterium sp.]|nr:MAG: hypothetical protein E6Q36_02680 [Chryseobacterium sp.]